MSSHISGLELVLQRYATEEEREQFYYLKELWDAMSVDERAARGLRRVTDLAPPDSPLRDAVRYTGRPVDLLMVNERHFEKVEIPVGIPGAKEALKRAAAKMLARYVRSEHQSCYVVGEFSDDRGRVKGFRTLIARHAL